MKILSNWRSVRLWESEVERDLRRRYSLRTHGLLIGSVALLLMWAVSSLVRHFGTHSLALRYLFTLGIGYVAYLLILRWWAQRLAEGRTEIDLDVPDAGIDPCTDTGYAPLAHADGTAWNGQYQGIAAAIAEKCPRELPGHIDSGVELQCTHGLSHAKKTDVTVAGSKSRCAVGRSETQASPGESLRPQAAAASGPCFRRRNPSRAQRFRTDPETL